jgi:hypothetical protein
MQPQSDPTGVRRIACLAVVVSVMCMLAAPGPASATGTWNLIWEENFDDGCADGWTLACCTPYDEVCVRPIGQSAALYGRSPAAQDANAKRPGTAPVQNHGGFTATSPDLAEMGLTFQQDYVIQFKYMLPEAACWTYVLASRPGLLVIENTVGDVARLGMLDHQHGNFQYVTDLTVGEWVDIKLRADPSPGNGLCNYQLFVDGTLVSAGTREDCLQYTGLQVMDVPARIAHEPVDPRDATPCFGAGYWDDFKVLVYEPDERGGNGRDRHVDIVPSPFNPMTSIKFEMEKPGRVSVSVFDVSGRLVRVLCNELRPAGLQVLEWNGRDDRGADVASGSYLVRVQTDGGQAVSRAVLVR